MQKWLFSFILSGLPLMAYNPKDGYFIEGGITTGLVESEEELATSPTPPTPPLPPNTQNQPNNNPIPPNKPQTKPDQNHNPPNNHNPQNRPDNNPTPPNNSNEIPKITQEQYLKLAAPTFTQNQLADSQNPVTMSTTDPIEITLKNDQLHIESFLPYNLTNVDLYMTNKEGQKVLVGQFADIDPFMRTTLSASLMPKIAQTLNQSESAETTPTFAATPYTPTFNLKTTSASSDQTTKVFQDLSQIWVDLNLRFVPIGGLDSTRWGVMTPLSAELLSDVFLDLAAVLSSNAFKTAVLNAPFALTSGPNSYKPNVVPKANGALPTPPTPPAKPADLNDPQEAAKYEEAVKEYEQEKQVYNASILSPQVVYERYTGAKTLNVDTVKGPEGLASSAIGGVGDFGVQPYLINYASQGNGAPSIYTSNNPFALNAWIWPLITVWHEFGHVNGYNHNGDMTYQNGWYGGRDQENPSGPHSEWAWDRFNEGQVQVGTNSLGQAIAKKSGIPIDIQQYGSANPEGGWFLAGMSGLGTAIWGELGQEGKLPIDYSSLPAATPNPSAPPTQPIKPLPPPYTSDATYQQELASYNAKMAEYETQIAKLEKEGTAFTAPVWFKAYAAAQAKSAEATYNKNLEKAKAKAASIAATHTAQSAPQTFTALPSSQACKAPLTIVSIEAVQPTPVQWWALM